MLRRNHEAIPPYAVAGLPALVLLLAVAAAGASPTLNATLGVDDPSSTGVVGDDLLSLSEAIRLAGGLLSPLALSEAERARIDGEPGANSPDLIRVELGEGAILTTPAGAPFGPVLNGNEGDVLDGGGAILRATGALPPGAIGLVTRSSRIEIRRFSFEGYPFGLIVSGSPEATDLEDIRISENTFSDYETGVVIAPNPNGSKGLRGLLIDGNRFVAGAGSINAIVVLGASPRVPGEVAADYVVEDVVIRKNEIRGGFGGIAFFGGQPAPETIVRDGRLAGLRIVGNDIRDVFDLSISVYAGFANRGGVISGVELSDVKIAGNRIASEGTPSTHIWVVPGAAVFEPGGLVENNVIRDVSIVRNRTSGGGECTGGIQIQASQNELGGGVVRGNLLERVRVYDNSVSDCVNGIGVFSGLAAAGHGLVEGNEIREVLLLGNRLTGNRAGVNMISGLGVEASAGPLPSSEPALIRGNLLHSISVVGNQIRGGVDGVLAIGGASVFTSDEVMGNSLSDGKEFENDSQFPCRVFQDVVLGDEGGAATDNRADFECSAPIPPKATGRPLRVTTLDDELNSDGDCSLREAIAAANTDAAVDACRAGRGADAIRLKAGSYVLSSAAQLEITGDLTIRGAGAEDTVIDAAQLGRVLHIAGWSVELEGLTIQNGLAPFDAGILNDGTLFLTHSIVRGNTAETSNGGITNLGAMVIADSSIVGNVAVQEFNGGIFNGAGARLTLVDSTVSGNTANRSNGGIANLGTMVIADSLVSENVATSEYQGGIFNGVGATLTLVKGTVSDNTANLSNGGINNAGTLEILDSSIVRNTAREFNGGIFNNVGATLNVVNSTVSGNAASQSNGGIFSFGTLELVHSTVSANAGGVNGGIFGDAGSSVTLKNSIVAGNVGRDCTGPILSAGHNLDGDSTCNLTATGDISAVDAMLGPLRDYGGPTETHALLSGSPAIDAIAVADCTDLDGAPVVSDQRGVARPQGAGCDIGAFERSFRKGGWNRSGRRH
jgi:CSLREA domain-containing protein